MLVCDAAGRKTSTISPVASLRTYRPSAKDAGLQPPQ
jgi:hypothetical protein